MNMVDNKTGGMFRMLLKLMQAESLRISTFDFDRLTFLFGRFFQIRDDYMNLRSGEYSDQKGFCEDLDEGKFSYPIVHCLEHHPEFKDHIIGIFRQRSSMLSQASAPLSREIKLHIVGYLKSTGTFKATWTYLNDLEAEIEAEIGKLENATGETNPTLRLLVTRLGVRDIVEGQGG
jgi:geranylgeranyl pyrophosphate synthase